LQLRADSSQFRQASNNDAVLQLNGKPRQMLGEWSGQIEVASEVASIHLPYYAVLRPGTDYSVTVTNVGIARDSDREVVTIPLRSSPADRAPFISIFQLGATHPANTSVNPFTAASDLIAVGVATDLSTQRPIAESNLYFGIASRGASPRPDLTKLIVLIDTNRDNVADWALIPGTDAGVAKQDLNVANDVLITAVRNERTREWSSGGYLNLFPADQFDTVPFNNSVFVLSISARTLGLSDAGSSFRYKAISRDWVDDHIIDQTAWLPFDAARPALDTVVYGAAGYPVRTNAGPLQVVVSRSNAEANGFSTANPLRLLVLHHLNVSDRRVQTVELNLDTDDVDHDGLPDSWELAHFNDLSFVTAFSDADADGALDRSEFQAGTDPNDPVSTFRFVTARISQQGQFELQWSTVSGRNYTVQSSTEMSDASFIDLRAHLPATPPVNNLILTNPPGLPRMFYRVKLDNAQ
jgi:hypothetical protein